VVAKSTMQLYGRLWWTSAQHIHNRRVREKVPGPDVVEQGRNVVDGGKELVEWNGVWQARDGMIGGIA
jgi:hypothetical protein